MKCQFPAELPWVLFLSLFNFEQDKESMTISTLAARLTAPGSKPMISAMLRCGSTFLAEHLAASGEEGREQGKEKMRYCGYECVGSASASASASATVSCGGGRVWLSAQRQARRASKEAILYSPMTLLGRLLCNAKAMPAEGEDERARYTEAGEGREREREKERERGKERPLCFRNRSHPHHPSSFCRSSLFSPSPLLSRYRHRTLRVSRASLHGVSSPAWLCSLACVVFRLSFRHAFPSLLLLSFSLSLSLSPLRVPSLISTSVVPVAIVDADLQTASNGTRGRCFSFLSFHLHLSSSSFPPFASSLCVPVAPSRPARLYSFRRLQHRLALRSQSRSTDASLHALLSHFLAVCFFTALSPPFLPAGVCGAVMVDFQHGTGEMGQLRSLMNGIAAHNVHPFVRLAANDWSTIGRCLDAGAKGVICPMVNTAEMAMDFAQACRYPPMGTPRAPGKGERARGGGKGERNSVVLQQDDFMSARSCLVVFPLLLP